MNCPNCKKEMIVVEREKIELDYCIFCKGFWFDNLEWNLLSEKLSFTGKKQIGDLYAIPPVIVKEEKKKCPKCGANMEKFLFFDIILDRCPKKHGVWFDEKEASKCFNSIADKSDTPINFLGEIFYKK